MRILANYGYKANGDMYSVTFETVGDVPTAQAPQAVDDLFRLAKEAIQRQLGHATPQAAPQPVGVPIPQPVANRVNQSPTAPQPIPTRAATAPPAAATGNGRKPQIKDPALPASPKQIGLLKRLAREKGRRMEDFTDLTMGEASTKIEELMAI